MVDMVGNHLKYVSSGIIRLPQESFPSKLKIIFDGITQIVSQYNPQTMGIEDVFFAKDPRAALKLGQARGAAIVACTNANLSVSEYSPRSVKQAVVGTGAADKKQVQSMVTALLKLPSAPSEDAADALAVAICHGHSMGTMMTQSGSKGFSRGRYK
jgi:crossover junction endodeoxyribonuclease RuvC